MRHLRQIQMVRRLAAIILAAGSLVVFAAASASAAAPADDYVALIDAYHAGQTREAVMALSNQEDKWIAAAHAAAMKSAASWPAGRLEAGVLLHTGVVTGGWVLPTHVALHLDAARRLLGASRDPRAKALRHQWLLVVCWHFQSELDLASMVPYLDELRDNFADDPETDLASGTFFEAAGWSVASPDSLPWNSRSRSRVLSLMPRHSQQEALEQAAAAFDRASRSPAVREEALVRLGHVQVLLGKPQDALARLTPLVSGASDRRWRYLAALFSALAEATRGNADAEAAAYRSASALAPGCQTPIVGLTALLRLQGSTTEAAALARTLTESDDRSCDDALWNYRFGPSPDRVPAHLEQLRKEFAP